MESLMRPEELYMNYYRCYECGHEWTDVWECMCDDECDECGAGDCTPVRSEQIYPIED